MRGRLFVDGRPVELASVDDARALGIECVYQDLALVNGLSIYHNMFLNRELLRRGPLRLLDHREMRRRAADALGGNRGRRALGRDRGRQLSGGQRQAIAVARAVYSQARILLLDEPLAAMGAREARLIIGLIERLRARGDIAIVMIAHNYAQTLEICDRVMLMQHGEVRSRAGPRRPRPKSCWRSCAANTAPSAPADRPPGRRRILLGRPDDQRVDDVRPSPAVDDDRVEVDLGDQVGVVGGKARQRGDQLGEGGASAGLAPRTPSSRAAPLSSPISRERLVGADRHRREDDIAQHLDMDAAEPDHQHRAEIGVAGDAEDDFDAGRRHLLHEHALDRGTGMPRMRTRQHLR